MRWLWIASVTVGCYSPAAETECTVRCVDSCPGSMQCGRDHLCHSSNGLECAQQPDASPGPDAVDAPACYGTGLLRVCMEISSSPYTVIGPVNLDTGTSCPMTYDPGGGAPLVCVVTGSDITIAAGATLRGYGDLPLVLLAKGSINVQGAIDVSSKSTDALRPGAGSTTAVLTCSLTNVHGNTNTTGDPGGGGGAGGSFVRPGAEGGFGGATSAGTPGSPASAIPATFVRAGCPGGSGGFGGNAGPGGGGAAGGAVYLIAGSTIVLSGAINASGSGGGGAGAQAGGGGGGSGGLIGLDAPMLSLASGALFANGGGGGGGAPIGAGSTDGADPAQADQPALGGAAPTGGGRGGAGSFAASPPAPGALGSSGGGGGGGGGGGAVRLFGVLVSTGAVISPPAN